MIVKGIWVPVKERLNNKINNNKNKRREGALPERGRWPDFCLHYQKRASYNIIVGRVRTHRYQN